MDTSPSQRELWKGLTVAFAAIFSHYHARLRQQFVRTTPARSPRTTRHQRNPRFTLVAAAAVAMALAVMAGTVNIQTTDSSVVSAQAATDDGKEEDESDSPATDTVVLASADRPSPNAVDAALAANLTDGTSDGDTTQPVDDCRSAVVAYMLSMGWNESEFRFDNFIDNPSERGDTSFSKGVVDTIPELVAFFNSDDERAAATRDSLRSNLTPVEYERAMRGEGYTLVQVTKDAFYEGNSYFTNEGARFYANPRHVEAGDQMWVFTDTNCNIQERANVRADCGNPEAIRLVPRPTRRDVDVLRHDVHVTTITKVTVVVTPPVVTVFTPPVVVTPPTVIVTPPPPVQPPTVVKYVPVCDTNQTPPVLKIVLESEATTPGYTADLTTCQPAPPPPVKHVPVCDTTQTPPAIITVPEADADKPGYKPVDSDDCKPAPPIEVCPEGTDREGQPVNGQPCDTPEPPHDECPNLPGDQPAGYECEPPVELCPEGTDREGEPKGTTPCDTPEPVCPEGTDREGQPVNGQPCDTPEPPHDECPNLPGDQPAGYGCEPPVELCPEGTDRAGQPKGDAPCDTPEPPVEDKCPEIDGTQDSPELCGDPDTGPSTPIPGSGNPAPAPTPGHEPGEAEETEESVSNPDVGHPLDPSEDGSSQPLPDEPVVITPVEQSATPADPAPAPNPDYDGSAPSPGTDEGTTDPDPGDTAGEEMPTGDPLAGGVDLPNVP